MDGYEERMRMVDTIPAERRAGFTLIELSVVLAVIGLLVGGIMVGTRMLRNAELNTIATDYNKYNQAVSNFRTQYKAIPGDFVDATEYWGTAHATAATCVTTASTATETCNGNGDWAINVSSGSNERFRFWQHLVNAGYITGRFSGVAASTNDNSTTSANAPASRLTNSVWYAANWGNSTPASAFTLTYNNLLELGGLVSNADPSGGIITPGDMYSIDRKIDDAMPGQGTLVARNIAGCTNASGGTPETDVTTGYKLSSTTTACALVFRQLFTN